MKHRAFYAMTACAVAATILACVEHERAEAKTPPHVTPRRSLAASVTDAGATVDDSGTVSFYLDGGAITPPFGGPPIDHCTVGQGFYGDFGSGTIRAPVTCGLKQVQVTVQLTPAQNGAIFNLVKAQAAAQLGVGLQ